MFRLQLLFVKWFLYVCTKIWLFSTIKQNSFADIFMCYKRANKCSPKYCHRIILGETLCQTILVHIHYCNNPTIASCTCILLYISQEGARKVGYFMQRLNIHLISLLFNASVTQITSKKREYDDGKFYNFYPTQSSLSFP